MQRRADPASVLARAGVARNMLLARRGELQEAYRLAIVHAGDFDQPDLSRTARWRHQFDSTAPQAVERRASRDIAALGIGLGDGFRLRLADQVRQAVLAQSPEAEQPLAQVLAEQTAIIRAAIENSNFGDAVLPAMRESLIANGIIKVTLPPGARTIHVEPIPLGEVALAPGPDGRLTSTYRRYKLEPARITELWPDAKLPDHLKQVQTKPAASSPEKVGVIEAVEWDDQRKGYHYQVILDGQSPKGEPTVLHEVIEPTSPFIAFSHGRGTGMDYGYGPVLVCLGFVKVANRVMYLNLKYAPIAMYGMWKAPSDGTFNPETARFDAGSVLLHSPTTAGPVPMQAPGRFDLSQLTLDDMRQVIRETIIGPDAVPDARGGARSPTELAIRRGDYAEQRSPTLARLWRHLMVPLAARTADLLRQAGRLGDNPILDGYVSVEPTSPLVSAQRAQEAAERLQGLEIVQATMPDVVPHLVDRHALAHATLVERGIPEHMLRTPEEARAAQEEAAQAAMLQQAAAGGVPV